jgi:hypothetical protein
MPNSGARMPGEKHLVGQSLGTLDKVSEQLRVSFWIALSSELVNPKQNKYGRLPLVLCRLTFPESAGIANCPFCRHALQQLPHFRLGKPRIRGPLPKISDVEGLPRGGDGSVQFIFRHLERRAGFSVVVKQNPVQPLPAHA